MDQMRIELNRYLQGVGDALGLYGGEPWEIKAVEDLGEDRYTRYTCTKRAVRSSRGREYQETDLDRFVETKRGVLVNIDFWVEGDRIISGGGDVRLV